MSDWRGFGVERCLKCGNLHTFNRINFPYYFMEETPREEFLVCKGCWKSPNKPGETNDIHR